MSNMLKKNRTYKTVQPLNPLLCMDVAFGVARCTTFQIALREDILLITVLEAVRISRSHFGLRGIKLKRAHWYFCSSVCDVLRGTNVPHQR
jgi:hypothetical protein